MALTITITPASGSITAKLTVCRITTDDVPPNTSTGYDTDDYPASPAVNYYFRATLAGQDDLVSNVFSTNADGFAEWNGLIFPAAGTWDLNLCNDADDSVVADENVVVAA